MKVTYFSNVSVSIKFEMYVFIIITGSVPSAIEILLLKCIIHSVIRASSLRQQPFSYLGGRGGGFFRKKYFNALADRNKI